MPLRSCGGRSWLAVSRSVDAGTWVSSFMRSGFANIPRPASDSVPNEGCVGTSPAGWPILRSTCANAIQRTSTTGRLGPEGRELGGARGGVDIETDSDSSDASRVSGLQVDLCGSPNPAVSGWVPRLAAVSDGAQEVGRPRPRETRASRARRRHRRRAECGERGASGRHQAQDARPPSKGRTRVGLRRWVMVGR